MKPFVRSHMRDIAKNAEEKGDFVTKVILFGRMTFHEQAAEQAAWMLRGIVAD